MLKKLLFCFVTIMVISPKLFSQGGAVYINRLWSVSTGNPVFNPILNPFGIKWSKTITCNSGEIVTVAHTTATAQGENILVTKFSASGTILFQKQHHTSSTNNEYGTDVVEDPTNGDIFVCGFTDNGGTSNYDGIVLKFDTYGNKTDSALFAHANGLNDVFTSIKLNASNHVVIGGSTENSITGYDYLVVKYTNSLMSPTSNFYDYSGLDDFGIGVEIKTGPNQINIIGASASTSISCDYAVAVFSGSSLSYISDARNNIPGTAVDQALAYCKDASDNIYITGKAFDGTSFNIKTVKISSTYSISWTATLNPNNFDDAGTSIAIDGTGNVIVGGYISNSSNAKNFICQKLNSSTGSQIWEYNQPSTNPSGDAYMCKLVVNSANNGIYYIAGEKGTSGNEQVLVGKIKPNGERNWMKSIASPTTNILPSDILTESGDIYVISVINPTASTYQTTKYSEFETDTASVFQSATPARLKGNIIVSFQQNVLKTSAINNKELVHGTISQFIDSATLATFIDSTGLYEFETYKCYKVHPDMVMADSLSVSRSGNVVKMSPNFSSFCVIVPSGINDTAVLNLIHPYASLARYAQFNEYVFLTSGANDPEYTNGNSSGLNANTTFPHADINIEHAWDVSAGTPAIKVGIYDTGINFQHQEFGNGTFAGSKISGGFNYAQNIPLSSVNSNDDIGHGSACAGIIGALRNNNFGVAGIAGGNGTVTGVSLYDMKIFSALSCSNDIVAPVNKIAEAIIKGASSNTVTGFGFGLDIQNHSWNGSSFYGVVLDAILDAYRNKVTLVFSSGNDEVSSTSPQCNSKSKPASHKDHILMKIGANDTTGGRAYFSNCGYNLDFIAPGVNSLYTSLSRSNSNFTDTMTWATGCKKAINGTSFAAPHAAGTAALIKSYEINTTSLPNSLFPEDIEHLMELSVTDLTLSPGYSVGYDSPSGHGRLNAGDALQKISYPDYMVVHYSFTASTSGAYQIGTSEKACLWESMFGLSPGLVNVKRFYFTGTNSHSIPMGYLFNTGWPLNVESSPMGINSSQSLTFCPTTPTASSGNYHEIYYLPDATQIIENSITSNSASFSGFTYQLLDANNNPVGWYPFSPGTTAEFAYSLHVKTPTAGIKKKGDIHSAELAIYPNPSSGLLTISLTKGTPSNITVHVFSALGQLVYSDSNLYLSDSKSLDLSFLPNGVYFIETILNGFRRTNKIIIAK